MRHVDQEEELEFQEKHDRTWWGNAATDQAEFKEEHTRMFFCVVHRTPHVGHILCDGIICLGGKLISFLLDYATTRSPFELE